MKYWIVPSNSKLFRMEAALRANNGFIDWRVKNVSVGDIVFMYKTMPDGCIKYMMEVVKTEFTIEEALDQKAFWEDWTKYNGGLGVYARFKLVDDLDEKRLNIFALRQHGINGNIQTKRSCPKETLDFILNSK